MKPLITGCNGLIGSHLVEHLLSQGLKVVGTYHGSRSNLEDAAKRLTLLHCDVTNRARVLEILEQVDPSVVFHMAAQSYPVRSWQDPGDTFNSNCLGTINLLEALRELKINCTTVVFGSSAEYGTSSLVDERIHERSYLEPSSPYGVSKLAADLLGLLYARAYQMRVVRVRPFFVIGPGSGRNVTIDFARSIAQLEIGASRELRVGNLAAVRDLLDVRDAVRALIILAEKGAPGEVYNLCSGRGYKIQDVLDSMVAMASVPIPVITDPNKFRPLDTPVVIGDNARLRALSWEPRISIKKTLLDILNFWRRQVRPSAPALSANH
jgi:GDP-4-dehydro-6-deoxy-D-mannose reductase